MRANNNKLGGVLVGLGGAEGAVVHPSAQWMGRQERRMGTAVLCTSTKQWGVGKERVAAPALPHFCSQIGRWGN